MTEQSSHVAGSPFSMETKSQNIPLSHFVVFNRINPSDLQLSKPIRQGRLNNSNLSLPDRENSRNELPSNSRIHNPALRRIDVIVTALFISNQSFNPPTPLKPASPALNQPSHFHFIPEIKLQKTCYLHECYGALYEEGLGRLM